MTPEAMMLPNGKSLYMYFGKDASTVALEMELDRPMEPPPVIVDEWDE